MTIDSMILGDSLIVITYIFAKNIEPIDGDIHCVQAHTGGCNMHSMVDLPVFLAQSRIYIYIYIYIYLFRLLGLFKNAAFFASRWQFLRTTRAKGAGGLSKDSNRYPVPHSIRSFIILSPFEMAILGSIFRPSSYSGWWFGMVSNIFKIFP